MNYNYLCSKVILKVKNVKKGKHTDENVVSFIVWQDIYMLDTCTNPLHFLHVVF